MTIDKNITICLNMIVRDESHIIKKTLQNILDKINITYWIISDTGSTDGTQQIIKDFFKENNINGELYEDEWRDFGYNRTKALRYAYDKTDYLLIFDADDVIVGNFNLKIDENVDSYKLKFGPNVIYYRKLLINNRIKWKFECVLHEYIKEDNESENPKKNRTEEYYDGDYYLISGRTGNRSKNPNKYLDDAIILENSFKIEKNKGIGNRYAFYCAQSYKCCGKNEKAIEWYKKVLTLDNWVQEKYFSSFELGNLYKKKKDVVNMMKYYLKTLEYDNERVEGVASLMEYFYDNGFHYLVNALYHKSKNHKSFSKIKKKLFINKYYWNNILEYYSSISSYYVANEKQTGYECCYKIIIENKIDVSKMKCTIKNLGFYLQKDIFDSFINILQENILKLFYKINELIGNEEYHKEDYISNVWIRLYELCEKDLTEYDISKHPKKHLIKKNIIDLSSPKILMTITSCKRYDLFEKTVNSVLNHWTDSELITDWFCVDDNSLDEDVKKMKNKYNFFEFYLKNEKEKGHRESMNIIFRKLKSSNYDYWIHMEDDFLFHTKMNYIRNALHGLNILKKENVKQIVFNRNYGETIESYKIKGHLNTKTPLYVMHNHINNDKSHGYLNCHYWPHYSLNPSLVHVKTILELGDYNSSNTFFERDYADKWNDAGYKTAFFNQITCRHIGRLLSERNDNTKKNAYNLNNVEQFINKKIKKSI
jgi:hypothetical protein